MTRFSSEQTLSVAGSTVTAAATSNAVKTETAKDARIYLDITAVPGAGETLDVFVQISADNVDFADVKAFNNIAAVSFQVLTLKEDEVGTFTRLRFAPSAGGTWELGATIEKKQGG